jgi:hypothetical protein
MPGYVGCSIHAIRVLMEDAKGREGMRVRSGRDQGWVACQLDLQLPLPLMSLCLAYGYVCVCWMNCLGPVEAARRLCDLHHPLFAGLQGHSVDELLVASGGRKMCPGVW